MSASVNMSLSGWGRYPVADSQVVRPEKLSGLRAALEAPGSLLARGLGRSYGDAALNPDGLTILTGRLNRLLHFDPETGVVVCEAGVSYVDLIEAFLPRGWFVPVTPGTRHVTMGGAVAFDIHGKNHHCDGAFSNHLRSLKLWLADGSEVRCSRSHRPELFWATVGGMGLTGLIVEVEMQLMRVRSAHIAAYNRKVENLEELCDCLIREEQHYRYSVAWVDCLARGRDLGRGIVMFGEHAEPHQLPPRRRLDPFTPGRHPEIAVPVEAPNLLLNKLTMGAFNTLYFNKQRGLEERRIVDYRTFFYPLDVVGGWNRLYGKRGFVQYQCVLPDQGGAAGLARILEECQRTGHTSYLSVLKRFGPQSDWLSFPFQGWTLAMDIPVRRGLWPTLERLDRIVLDLGGRVYLAKDARLRPDYFRAMYPAYPRWLKVKQEVDPEGRFSSSLSRRLKIGEP